MKTGTLLAIVVFSVVALAHLLRLVMQAEITVDGVIIPMWTSYPGVALPAVIAYMLWRERS
jgi:hypothetical protein